MIKHYLLLVIMTCITMCATPSPAQNIWPSIEKQNFRYTCWISLKDDPELRGTFSSSMLKSICSCAADRWENAYDWQTFAEITKPPLDPYIEQQFFDVSYDCAMKTLSKFKIKGHI